MEICLYATEFQRKLKQLDKDIRKNIDKQIKDFIGKIRKIRDC